VSSTGKEVVRAFARMSTSQNREMGHSASALGYELIFLKGPHGGRIFVVGLGKGRVEFR
jgi:hypothetical protein